MTKTTHISRGQTTLYAAGADFCRIFSEDMQNLYLLALLLTADPAKAEQCFVCSLDDCVAGNQVFKEWARSWARRAIIKNAIRLIVPQPVYTNGVSIPGISNNARRSAQPELQVEMSALFELQPFERFVFVMSVLEGYSDRDCTLLLACTRESLVAARLQALRQIASPVDAYGKHQAGTGLRGETSQVKQGSVSGRPVPAGLATPA